MRVAGLRLRVSSSDGKVLPISLKSEHPPDRRIEFEEGRMFEETTIVETIDRSDDPHA
jgi:hypothetical protein